jgi:hypothetical protein
MSTSLEQNLPLICKCGNRDHGTQLAECSAGCGRRMLIDTKRLIEWCYTQGWARGVSDYAVWKDGEQLVGVMQRPLKGVIEKGPDKPRMSIDLEIRMGGHYP